MRYFNNFLFWRTYLANRQFMIASNGLLAVMSMAVYLFNPAHLQGQTVFYPSSSGQSETKVENLDRSLAALKLSLMAAESGLKEVSFEAVRRAMGEGPPISNVEIGGLLGSTTNNQPTYPSSTERVSDPKQAELVNSLIKVAKVWKEQSFPAAKCYPIWKTIVFTDSRPSEAFAYSNHVKDTSYSWEVNLNKKPKPAAIASIVEIMVKSARDADKLDDMHEAMSMRKDMPAAKPVVRLIEVLLALEDSAKQESLCRELAKEPKLLFSDLNSDLLFFHVYKIVKKLPQESAARKELWEAVLNEAEAGKFRRDSWLGYAIRIAAIESIKKGDKDLFDRYTRTILNTFNSVRSGNESYLNQIESQYYETAATFAFDAGQLELGVNCLAQSLSRAAASEELGSVSFFGARSPFVKQLLKLEPVDRFKILDQLVWSMPKLGLKNAAMVNARDDIPERFLTAWKSESGQSQFPFEKLTDVDAFSTSLLEIMMRDAKSIGKLAEIEQRIEELKDRKSDDLVFAKLIWSRVQNKSFDLSLAKTGEDKQGLLYGKDQEPLGLPLEIEIARAALADPVSRELGSALLKRIMEIPEFRTKTVGYHANQMLLEADAAEGKTLITPACLKHFGLASEPSQSDVLLGNPQRTTWHEKSQGVWEPRTGGTPSIFFLKYPLQGEYEIKLRCHLSDHDRMARMAINNVAVGTAENYLTFSVNGEHNAYVPIDQPVEGNSVTFTVNRKKADSVKVLLNNENSVELLIADNEFPFLGFPSVRSSGNSFEWVSITGNYSIPSIIELLTPKLLGWSANAWGGNLKRVTVLKPKDEDGESGVESEHLEAKESEEEKKKADVPEDWRLVEQVLESVDHAALQKIDKANKLEVNKEKLKRREAWLYYARPLLDGEQFDFEYWYEPGKFTLWPTIDRIAIGIEPDQLFEHWITSDSGEWFGVSTENRLKLESKDSTRKMQLKSSDWNAVSMRRTGDTISMSINGVMIHEQPVDKLLNGRFGFFHDPKNFQVRVRKAVLSGDWPDKLPENLMEKNLK